MWIRNLLTEKTLRTILPHVMGNFKNKLIRILKKILDYIINIKSAEMKNIFLLTTFLLILFGCEKEKESDNEYNIPINGEILACIIY